MAAGEDLIDFDVIEHQKENIQSLPSGRSAKALASVFSPLAAKPSPPSYTQDINSAARQVFEQELLSADDSDDPLDVYDRYVKWTLNTYPSAQTTPQSQLLPLLERATKAFISSAHYKNDSRYLRIWLHFIRFCSDSPRETFVYLSRHGVGESLALYYEEFAAWLESQGRWKQAEELYHIGIDKGARPTERLARKFGEFDKRKEAHGTIPDEPSSPALPSVRPALAAKIDPFAAHSPSTAPTQGPQQSGRPKKGKLEIFSDAGTEEARPGSGASAKGWESIGTIADRKKENTVAAKPWTGETLKSSAPRAMGVPKMTIFKDQSKINRVPNSSSSISSARAEQLRAFTIVNPRTGRLERVAVNLEAVYPNPNDLTEEYSFEELRARRRGWLAKGWASGTSVQAREVDIAPATVPVKFDESPVKKHFNETLNEITVGITERLILNDENDENGQISRGARKSKDEVARRLRKEERANRTRKIKVREVKQETQTIQTNLDSPRGPRVRKKKVAEPTMTLVTKAAMEDVYDIFNQSLQPVNETNAEDNEESDEESDDEDDYTSGGESTGTGRLSANTSEFGDDTRGDLDTIDDITTAEADVTTSNDTEWTELNGLKDAPEDSDDDEMTTEATKLTSTNHTEVAEDMDVDEEQEKDVTQEEITTPTSPSPQESRKTFFVPVQPEDYEPPTRQNPYRDPASRLPFMTPIVEKTESSLGTITQKHDIDYFSAKTPCPKNASRTPTIPEQNELWSSPLQEPDDEPTTSNIEPLAQPKLVRETAKPTAPAQPAREARPHPQTSVKSIAEIGSTGPIIKDIQINPMDPGVHEIILSALHPPLQTYTGYHDHASTIFAHRADVKRYCKAIKANGKQTSAVTASDPSGPVIRFPESSHTYNIRRELGAGAFAPVYLAERMPDDTNSSQPQLVAIKLESSPPSAWEFHMISLLKNRLGASARSTQSVIQVFEHHAFADEHYLIESYRDQGTLLDLVNALREGPNTGVDEMLAMFFAVELLRTLEACHKVAIIHGDLKGDNVMIRLPLLSSSAPSPAETENLSGYSSDLSSAYKRDGTGGWAARGVSLIDFGRAIDMRNFAPGVGFIADWEVGATDCAEMRECRVWTHQIDYFGLAGVLHTLLFGRYIESVVDGKAGVGIGGGKRYKLKEGLKRYWQTEIWADCFGMLLNPQRWAAEGCSAAAAAAAAGGGDVDCSNNNNNSNGLRAYRGEKDGKMPLVAGMRHVRERMEDWLEANSERGIGLKGLIRRAEGLGAPRRR